MLCDLGDGGGGDFIRALLNLNALWLVMNWFAYVCVCMLRNNIQTLRFFYVVTSNGKMRMKRILLRDDQTSIGAPLLTFKIGSPVIDLPHRKDTMPETNKEKSIHIALFKSPRYFYRSQSRKLSQGTLKMPNLSPSIPANLAPALERDSGT